MKSFLIIILILIPTYALATMNVWVDTGSIKLRQQGDYTGTGQQTVQNISLKCAKNEFEPLQVFVYANGETLTNVDVTVTNLVKGTDTIDDIYIYKELYINITSPGRSDYQAGLWPDPLIPKVDRYYHETRNAFPFSVTSGNVQGVWVDLGATASTPAGTYTGTYTVTADGKTPVTGTITLKVWNFALPSTATQKNMWMIGPQDLEKGFYGTDGLQAGAWVAGMLNLAGKAFLYHRIALSHSSITFNSIGSDGTVTFSANYATAIASLMDGTAISSGPYAGARKTAEDIELAHTTNQSYDSSDVKWQKVLQSYWDYYYTTHSYDPINTLFARGIDEPSGASYSYHGGTYTDYQIILMKMANMNAVNTGGQGAWLNTFTTKGRNPTGSQAALSESTPNLDTEGLWCPLYFTYEYRYSDPTQQHARATYPDIASWPTRQHWCYFANDATNYDIPVPDHSTETPAYWTRAISWIDWTYRCTGDFYYETTHTWPLTMEPYVNTKYVGENGQDVIFYPGIASKSANDPTGTNLPASTPEIGGTHDIPIESMKMKVYREGMEDYEYMELLRAQGKTLYVDGIVDTIYNATPWTGGHGKYFSVKADISPFLSARDTFGTALDGNSPVVTLSVPSGTYHTTQTVALTSDASPIYYCIDTVNTCTPTSIYSTGLPVLRNVAKQYLRYVTTGDVQSSEYWKKTKSR